MSGVMRKCETCRGAISEASSGLGRMRVYCSQACRQRAYEVRRAQRQLLGDLGVHHTGHPAPRRDLPPLPTGAWRAVLGQLRHQLRATTIDPGDRDDILSTLRVILADHDQDEPRAMPRPAVAGPTVGQRPAGAKSKRKRRRRRG